MLFFKKIKSPLPTVIYKVATFVRNVEKGRFEFRTADLPLCLRLQEMGYESEGELPQEAPETPETPKAPEAPEDEKAPAEEVTEQTIAEEKEEKGFELPDVEAKTEEVADKKAKKDTKKK